MLTHFLTAFGISLLGSLPFGMINLNVLATAVARGKAPALTMGAGAVLVEGMQILLVLILYGWLAGRSELQQWLQIGAVPVFLGLAAWYLLRPAPLPGQGRVVERAAFLRGMGLSVLNVLVYPFWLFWLGWLAFPIEERTSWTPFLVGAVLGAYAVMIGFTFLGRLIDTRAHQVARHLRLIIGLIFLGLGIWQLIRIWS